MALVINIDNKMKNEIFDWIKIIAILIGIRFLLKDYASAIAHGIAEGWAKVTHITNIVHKNDDK